MKKNVEKALNEQINAEMYSAYLYLSMATYFDGKGLNGFAHWMKKQAEEEMVHAFKIYDYVYERDGSVVLDKIDQPPSDFASALDIFEKALEHEKHVTSLINGLYELALEEKDYALQSFLKWFIDEQVEEEASASDVIERLKIAGEKGPGLYMLDRELMERGAEEETTA
jgi:ferritin